MTRTDRLTALEALAAKRVLILDGAMGTQIQQLQLEENDFSRPAICRLVNACEGQQRYAEPDQAR